jgi:hypothetical protein
MTQWQGQGWDRPGRPRNVNDPGVNEFLEDGLLRTLFKMIQVELSLHRTPIKTIRPRCRVPIQTGESDADHDVDSAYTSARGGHVSSDLQLSTHRQGRGTLITRCQSTACAHGPWDLERQSPANPTERAARGDGPQTPHASGASDPAYGAAEVMRPRGEPARADRAPREAARRGD